MSSLYEMEELVPIVGKLAEKYTSHESTSITYERAEMLMEAVLYCIHEAEQTEKRKIVAAKEMTAVQMYEIGFQRVEEKVKKALSLYNDILPIFSCYGSRCLEDVFVKGLPEFFQRYDARFEPQNTILTLDYPVLKDIFSYTGIDRIYEFIKCIDLEQKFLGAFPEGYVTGILSRYDEQYEELTENICGIVLLSMAGHFLAGRPLAELTLQQSDYMEIQNIFARSKLSDIKERLEEFVKEFVQKYCDDSDRLLDYLEDSAEETAVRLKKAAEYDALGRLI